MKIAPVLLFFLTAITTSAATLVEWNFNSIPPDAAASTGSLIPSIGSGLAEAIGTPNPVFAAGAPSDPAEADNSGWQPAPYPTQNSGNKTAGGLFRTSTQGYKDLAIGFHLRASNTGSRYYRLQVSVDGVTFVDGPVVTLTAASVYQVFSFSLDRSLENNTKFAFRIVAEFESTATGSGRDGYVAVNPTAAYAPNGTVRFDLVTLTGEPAPPTNSSPSVSAISPQFLYVFSPTDLIKLSVSDLETAASKLIVTAESGMPSLIPESSMALRGSGSDRTLQLTATEGELGVAVITLTVSDGQLVSERVFPVMVLPSIDTYFYEPFRYPDGQLRENSGSLWSPGEELNSSIALDSERVKLVGHSLGAVHGNLAGSPYVPGRGEKLFLSAQVRFLELPSGTDYFLHYNHGVADPRARLFTASGNAAPGMFRLGLANGTAEMNVEHPSDLSLNSDYFLVICYDLDAALTVLWIDPKSELDPSIIAADVGHLVVPIESISLRQHPGIGTVLIDNLKIGRSFNDVARLPRLRIQQAQDFVRISWRGTAERYQLEFSPETQPFSWRAAPEPAFLEGNEKVVEHQMDTQAGYFRLRQQ